MLKRAGFFRELRHGDVDGPVLQDAVGRLPSELKDRVVHYLEAGHALAATPGWVDDVLKPDNKHIGSPNLMTDGEWMWPLDLAYYVRQYSAAPPAEFIRHMELSQWSPKPVTKEQSSRLIDELLGQEGIGTEEALPER
jgi:hypothetical protein